MKFRVVALAVAVGAGLGAASCATDSYHAYDAGEGYSEERIAPASWRVSFVGSTIESQAAVEQQLLRRSAELTLESGYEWFAPGEQSVQQEEDIVVTGERPRAAPADSAEAVWRPRWRRRSASRWTDWDPQGARSTADAPEAPPQTPARAERFSATAEISMGRGEAPPGAFDARSVLSSQSQ